jgi:hypothetical protein
VAYKTLGEMRSTLQTRLGFGSAGAAAGVNAPIIDNFLFNAQVQLYWQVDWKKLTTYADKTVGVGQTLVDYPTVTGGAPADANPERILKIAVKVNTLWIDLNEGIETQHYSYVDRQYYPQRYERYAQIELWPQADQTYTVRIWYIKALARFTQDGDRATVDDDLLFLHALANAKAHYHQPDAQFYSSQLSSMLSELKSKTWGKKHYRRAADESVAVRPKVI